MAVLEIFLPRRKFDKPRTKRWPSHFGLVVIDTILLRFLFPTAAVGAAVYAETHQLGLLNSVSILPIVKVVTAFLILDLVIYWQHVIFHKIPILWRLHRVHHTDMVFDFTTALRFHPVEIVLSMLLKIGIIFVIGAPAFAVLLFEIVLNGTAMFNHGNINIPQKIDRLLRLFVVTPDMHRVHHSPHRHETDSNFGFNIPWWDRLFGTYRDQPDTGHQAMTIGQSAFRTDKDSRLDQLLLQPLR